MNSVKYLEGLDALLNGEDGGIGRSLNNTSYYAPQNLYQDMLSASSETGVSVHFPTCL